MRTVQLTPNERLGDQLRKCREYRGLSQDGLARLVGKSPQAIHHYEAGKRNIPALLLFERMEEGDKFGQMLKQVFESPETDQEVTDLFNRMKAWEQQEMDTSVSMKKPLNGSEKEVEDKSFDFNQMMHEVIHGVVTRKIEESCKTYHLYSRLSNGYFKEL